MQSRFGRIGTVLVLMFALVAGSLAFTAANTVPASKAGDGSGAVTGYTVSGIHYGLNASNPANVDSVSFTLDSVPVAGSTMTAQIGGNWYSCTNSGANVTCNTTSPQATVLPVVSLRIIVAD
jgi:hypothetical protein